MQSSLLSLGVSPLWQWALKHTFSPSYQPAPRTGFFQQFLIGKMRHLVMRLHRRCPFLLAFLLLPRGKHFSAAERGQVRLDAASTANTRAKMFPHTARTHSGFPGPTAAQGRAQLGAECRGAAHCPTATKGGHLPRCSITNARVWFWELLFAPDPIWSKFKCP